MTKKLTDVIEDFLSLPPEVQLERVRAMRERKFVVKPAVVVRRKKAATKAAKVTQTKAQKIVKQMSPEEKKKLIALLKGG